METVNNMLNEFGDSNKKQKLELNQISSGTTIKFNAYEYQKSLKYAIALVEQKIDITRGYHNWMPLAYSFVNTFSETGRDLFHMISSASHPGYNETDTNKLYSECLKGSLNYKGEKATIDKFYKLAQEAGIVLSTPKSSDSKNRDHQKEAYEMITSKYDISFDELNQDILVDGKPFDEFTLNTILIDLNVNHKIKVKKDFVQSVIESKFTKTANQFLSFVEKYKDRNPTGLIEKLSNCVVTKTGSNLDFNYKFKMFTLFFVKMIAQILSHVPNDLCLVFLGGKFIGKTYFFSNLLPSELLQFFSVQSFKNDKDFRRDSGRYILILDDEFKYLRVATNELIKSLLSAITVTVRVPYGRKPMAYKRIASYCISTNERFILKDHTGNRRLLCFWVDSINWDEFNSIDKVDLIIEAYHLYKSGYNHVLDKTLLDAIEEVSSEFEEISSAEELLKQHLPPANLLDRNAFWWPVSRIVKELSETVGHKLSDYEIGKALRKLGYSNKFMNVHGSKLCCWLMKFGSFGDDNFVNKHALPDDFFELSADQLKINDLPPLDENKNLWETGLDQTEIPG